MIALNCRFSKWAKRAIFEILMRNSAISEHRFRFFLLRRIKQSRNWELLAMLNCMFLYCMFLFHSQNRRLFCISEQKKSHSVLQDAESEFSDPVSILFENNRKNGNGHHFYFRTKKTSKMALRILLSEYQAKNFSRNRNGFCYVGRKYCIYKGTL
jgi:hypothetical protein